MFLHVFVYLCVYVHMHTHISVKSDWIHWLRFPPSFCVIECIVWDSMILATGQSCGGVIREFLPHQVAALMNLKLVTLSNYFTLNQKKTTWNSWIWIAVVHVQEGLGYRHTSTGHQEYSKTAVYDGQWYLYLYKILNIYSIYLIYANKWLKLCMKCTFTHSYYEHLCSFNYRNINFLVMCPFLICQSSSLLCFLSY